MASVAIIRLQDCLRVVPELRMRRLVVLDLRGFSRRLPE